MIHANVSGMIRTSSLSAKSYWNIRITYKETIDCYQLIYTVGVKYVIYELLEPRINWLYRHDILAKAL